MEERTLMLIKPAGEMVKARAIEAIRRIYGLGLRVENIKERKLTSQDCAMIYPQLKEEKPDIYVMVREDLMSGFSIILVISGEDAIQKVLNLRGPTFEPPPGTLRFEFTTPKERELFRTGQSVRNAVHAAGDAEEAETAIAAFDDF